LEKVYFKVILEIKYHRTIKTIVAGDGSWCFVYDPQTKRQSPTWLIPGAWKIKNQNNVGRTFRLKGPDSP